MSGSAAIQIVKNLHPFTFSPSVCVLSSSERLLFLDRLDLTDPTRPVRDSLIHLSLHSLDFYSLWIILPKKTIANHDSQILISRPDLLPWIPQPQVYCLLTPMLLRVLSLCLEHSVVSGSLLH